VAELVRSISEHQDGVESQMSIQRHNVGRAHDDVEAAANTMLSVIKGIELLNQIVAGDVAPATEAAWPTEDVELVEVSAQALR
jgi:hypothetical protein